MSEQRAPITCGLCGGSGVLNGGTCRNCGGSGNKRQRGASEFGAQS